MSIDQDCKVRKGFAVLYDLRRSQSDAHAVMQDSHDALHLASYSQPLRGTPIESLPAAQAATYVVNLPAPAAPASEAALEDGSSPRTPVHRTHSARASLTACLRQHGSSRQMYCVADAHIAGGMHGLHVQLL